MTSATLARWVALPVGVLAVSTSGILIRLASTPPLVTATNRLLGGATVLLLLALLLRRDELRRLDRAAVPFLLLSGLLLGLHFALWTSSLFWTSVASAVLLTDTHPAIDAAVARSLLGEYTAPGVWVGIAMTLLGTIVIAGGDVQAGGTAVVGDLMALGAAVMMTGYLVVGRKLRRSMSTVVYAGLVYAVASLVVAALATASGLAIFDYSARDGLIFLGLVLGPTLCGHTVFNWSLRHLSVAVVGVAIVGEPVVTTFWAWLLLGEAPAATALVGGALTLAGIVLALRAGQVTPVGTGETTRASN